MSVKSFDCVVSGADDRDMNECRNCIFLFVQRVLLILLNADIHGCD